MNSPDIDFETSLAQFRARLKSLRLLQGLTQSDLAEKADISIEHVSKLERGGAAPSFKTICTLARALETEPASLFLFEPPAEDKPQPSATGEPETPLLAPYITRMGSFSLDLATGTFTFSPDMYRLLGLEPGDPLDTPEPMITRFIHPDDQHLLEKAVAELMRGNNLSRVEYRFIRVDGQVRHGLMHCEVEKDPTGAPLIARGACLDVTEFKRLETLLHKARVNLEGKVRRDQEQLQAAVQELDEERRERERLEESMALFDRLIAASKDYMAFVDQTYTYRAMSDSYRVLIGKDPKTLVHHTVEEVLGRSTFRKHIKDRLDHALRGNAVRYRSWIDTPNLGRRFLDVAYHPYVQNGKVLGIVALSRDDTEHRLMEEALAQSERRYRLLADTMADVIWTLDQDLRLNYVSPSVQRLLGHTPEGLLLIPQRECLTPESYDLLRTTMDQINEARETGEWDVSSRLLELEQVRKDGSTVWTEVLWSPILGPNREFLGASGMTRDISERRKAEAEIRERDAIYRLLAENMRDVIWTLDENFRITWSSPSAQTMLGYTPEEVAGLDREQRYPPHSVARFKELVLQVRQAEKDGNWDQVDRVFEIEHICKDGSTVLTEISWTPIQGEDGRFMGATGVTRDIEERRKAQAALAQSEERFRLLAENMPVLVHAHDEQGRYVFWNKECQRVTGYTTEEAMAPGFYERLFPDPEYQALIMSYFSDTTSRYRDLEFDWVCADGGKRTIAWSNISPDCPVPGWAMWETGVDVTERRAAEAALAQSEKDFRFLAENSRAAIFRMSLPDGSYEYMSPAVREIAGYEAEEFLQNPMKVAEIMHPDFKEFFAQAWQELLQGRTPPRSLYKIFNASGEERWIEQHNTLIYDDQGRAVGFEGVGMDVTPRMKAEEVLRQSRLTLEAVLNATHDITLVLDPQGVILEANEALAEILSMDRGEAVGRNLFDLLPADVAKTRRKCLDRVLASGQVEEFQDESHGRIFEHTVFPVRNDRGVIFRFATFSKDVTERLRTEAELRSSEKLLRLLTENMQDVVWAMDPDLNVTYISPSIQRLRGLTPEQSMAGSWLDSMTPESRAKVLAAMESNRAALARGGSAAHVNLELEQQHANGSFIWIEASATPVVDEAGALKGYVGVTRNISSRKAAEEGLRQSEARYRLLFENACDAIYVHDMQGRFMDANAMACERLGYEREDILALTPEQIDIPEEASKVGERIAQLLDKGHLAFETIHRRKDGSRMPTDVNATLVSLGGEPAVLTIVRDAADRKRREGNLVLAKQQAELAERSTSEFLSCLSNEIRTPLASILDMLQFMGLSTLSWDQRRYLDMAVDSSRGLVKIMDDIQDLSSVEDGSTPLRQEPFAVAEFLDAALSTAREQAQAKGIPLALHVSPEVPENLRGDPYRLHQVLSCLLMNSVLSTERGEIRLSAAMGAGQGDMERLLITLTDTRPDLSDEERDRIFMPCITRADTATHPPGHGLALTIARRLVLAMGGDIAVSNPGGKGLGFTLHVPVQAAHKSPEPGRPACAVSQVHVLVVDDDETNLFTLRSMLKHLGHTCTTLDRGDKVLAALAQEPFDLVLMDVRMPVMNGLEATRRIRASNAPWSGIPVAAITAHALKGDMDHCLAHGMDAYLAKPVTMEDLAGLIETLCLKGK